MLDGAIGFLGNAYLWVKAAHLTFVIFWIAGLFLLPRFYVYHHATAAGSAALAAVGAGLWDSTLEIGERIPVGGRVTPQRDDAWRERNHAEWKRFVQRAAELG